MGHYLNQTGRPILYSCEWPLYMRALGATVCTKRPLYILNSVRYILYFCGGLAFGIHQAGRLTQTGCPSMSSHN